MKTRLTVDESKELIVLGINSELASDSIIIYPDDEEFSQELVPIFTLQDLVEIVPKVIDDYHLEMAFCDPAWQVHYELYYGWKKLTLARNIELIDALFDIVKWCIKEGYIK